MQRMAVSAVATLAVQHHHLEPKQEDRHRRDRRELLAQHWLREEMQWKRKRKAVPYLLVQHAVAVRDRNRRAPRRHARALRLHGLPRRLRPRADRLA